MDFAAARKRGEEAQEVHEDDDEPRVPLLVQKVCIFPSASRREKG